MKITSIDFASLTRNEKAIINKMEEYEIKDYSDEELYRVFKNTVAPKFCIKVAKDLIARGILK